MADETQIGTTVTAGLEQAQETAAVVLDHADTLVTTLQAEIQKGKQGLVNLKAHSAATAVGSTVQLAIDHFSGVFQTLEAALGLYKTQTAAVVAEVPVVVVPPATPIVSTSAATTPAGAGLSGAGVVVVQPDAPTDANAAPTNSTK